MEDIAEVGSESGTDQLQRWQRTGGLQDLANLQILNQPWNDPSLSSSWLEFGLEIVLDQSEEVVRDVDMHKE